MTIALLLFAGGSAPSFATPTRVQSQFATNTTGTTLVATFGAAVTAGNLIIVRATTNDPTITVDTAGYTLAVKSDNTTDGDTCGIWFKEAAGGETAVQISTAGNTKHLWIEEWSGLSATPLDKTAASGTTAGATTKDCGTTGTLTQAAELIVTSMAIRANTTAESTGAPFTIDQLGDGTFSAIFTSAVVSATTSQTPSNSWTTAGTAWGCTATFMAAASGGGGGGTTFTKDLSGTITVSGIIVRRTSRTLTGSLTGSSTITKVTSRRLTSTVTPAGSLSRAVAYLRTLTGSITPSGVDAKLIILGTPFTGSITPTASIAFTTVLQKFLTGSITPSGATTRFIARTLLGTITVSGTVSKLITRSLSGAITMSGSISRAITRTLTGSITPTASIAMSSVFLKSLSGTITAAGAVARLFIPPSVPSTLQSTLITLRRFIGRR